MSASRVIVSEADGTVMEFWLDECVVSATNLNKGLAIVISGLNTAAPTPTGRAVVNQSGDVLAHYDVDEIWTTRGP